MKNDNFKQKILRNVFDCDHYKKGTCLLSKIEISKLEGFNKNKENTICNSYEKR